jgi:hypothetical protein
MRQWKIAISLAIVGAIAAPFISGTWQNSTTRRDWVPITEDQANKASVFVKATNNCRTFDDPKEYDQIVCHILADQLRDGGTYSTVSLRREYWMTNAAVSLAALVIIFSSAMILPAVALRYWRWLKA